MTEEGFGITFGAPAIWFAVVVIVRSCTAQAGTGFLNFSKVIPDLSNLAPARVQDLESNRIKHLLPIYFPER